MQQEETQKSNKPCPVESSATRVNAEISSRALFMFGPVSLLEIILAAQLELAPLAY